jgi:hypothetical protein
MDIEEIGSQEMEMWINNPAGAKEGLYFAPWADCTWMCLAVVNGTAQKHRSAKINFGLDWLNAYKNQNNANTT